jgi:hypothetical protein
LRRNCLLQRVIEGKIQGGIKVTGRQGRRRRKLFDDHKERRGYPHLKEEALDRTMWRARFGRGFGPVVRLLLLTSSVGATARCGLKKKKKYLSICPYLSPTLSIFSLSTLEDLFPLLLSTFSWVFLFVSSHPVLE